jgi:hypothetical protein
VADVGRHLCHEGEPTTEIVFIVKGHALVSKVMLTNTTHIQQCSGCERIFFSSAATIVFGCMLLYVRLLTAL